MATNLDKIKSGYLDYFNRKGVELNDFQLEELNKLIITEHATELGFQSPKVNTITNSKTLYDNLGFLEDYSIEGGVKKFVDTPRAPERQERGFGEQALIDLGSTLWHFSEQATFGAAQLVTPESLEHQMEYENLSPIGKVGAVVGGTAGFLVGFGKLKALLKAPSALGKVYSVLGNRKITGETLEAGVKQLVKDGVTATEQEAKDIVLGVMRSQAGKRTMKAMDNAHDIGRATKDMLRQGMHEGLTSFLAKTGRQMGVREGRNLVETVATGLNRHHVNTIHKLVQRDVTGKLSNPVAKYITNYAAKWADDFLAFGAHGVISTALVSVDDDTEFAPIHTLKETLKFTAFLPLITSIKVPGVRPGGQMGLIKDRKIIGALFKKFPEWYKKGGKVDDLSREELNLLVGLFTRNTKFKDTAIAHKLGNKIKWSKNSSGEYQFPDYTATEAKEILTKIYQDVTPSMMKAMYSKELGKDFLAAVPRMLTGAIYFNLGMLDSEEGKYLKNIHPEVFWTHLLVGGFLTKHHSSILMDKGVNPHVNEFTKNFATFNLLSVEPSKTVKIWTNNLAKAAVWSGLFNKEKTNQIESFIRTDEALEQTLKGDVENRDVLTNDQILKEFPVLFKVFNRVYKELHLSKSAVSAYGGEISDRIDVDLNLLGRDTLKQMENGLRKLALEDGTLVNEKNVHKFIDEYKQSVPDTIERSHLRFLQDLASQLGIQEGAGITVELDSKDKGDIKKIKVQQILMEGVSDHKDIGVISEYNQLITALHSISPDKVEIVSVPAGSKESLQAKTILKKIGVEKVEEGESPTEHSKIRENIDSFKEELKRDYMGSDAYHYTHDLYNGVYLEVLKDWKDHQVFKDSFRFFREREFKDNAEADFHRELEEALLFDHPSYSGQKVVPLTANSYNVLEPNRQNEPNWDKLTPEQKKKLISTWQEAGENVAGALRNIARLVGFGKVKTDIIKDKANIPLSQAIELVNKAKKMGIRGVGDSRRNTTISPIIDYFYRKTFDSIAVTPDKRAVYMHGVNSGVFELLRDPNTGAPLIKIPSKELFIDILIKKEIIEDTDIARAEASKKWDDMYKVVKMDKVLTEVASDLKILTKSEESSLREYYTSMGLMTREKIISSINEYKDVIEYAKGLGIITREAEMIYSDIIDFANRIKSPEGLEGLTNEKAVEKLDNLISNITSLREEVYKRFTNEKDEFPESSKKLIKAIDKAEETLQDVSEAFGEGGVAFSEKMHQLLPLSESVSQLVGELKIQDAYIQQASRHARSLVFAMTSGRGSRSDALRWGAITKKALIDHLNTLKKETIIDPEKESTVIEIYEKFEQYGALETFKDIIMQKRIAWEKTISEEKYQEMKQNVRDVIENNILTGAEETLKYSLTNIANEYGRHNPIFVDKNGKADQSVLDSIVDAFVSYENPIRRRLSVKRTNMDKLTAEIKSFLDEIKKGIEGKHAGIDSKKERDKNVKAEYEEFINRKLYPLLKAVLARKVLPSVRIVEAGAKSRVGDKKGNSEDIQYYLEGPTEKPFSEGGITEFYENMNRFVDDVYFVYSTSRLSEGMKDIDMSKVNWEKDVNIKSIIAPEVVSKDNADMLKSEDITVDNIHGSELTRDWGNQGSPKKPVIVRLTDGVNVVVFENRINKGQLFEAFNEWYGNKITQVKAKSKMYDDKSKAANVSAQDKKMYIGLRNEQNEIIKTLNSLTEDIRNKSITTTADGDITTEASPTIPEMKFMLRAMYYDKNIPNWDLSYLHIKRLNKETNKLEIPSQSDVVESMLKFQKYFWQSENAGSFYKSRDSIYEAMEKGGLISKDTIITTTVGTSRIDHSLDTAWQSYKRNNSELKIVSIKDEFDVDNNPLTARNVVSRALNYIKDRVSTQSSKDAIDKWSKFIEDKKRSGKFTSSLDASAINAQGYLSTNAAILIFNGTGYRIGDNIAGAKPVVRWIDKNTAEVIIGKTHFIYDKELAEKYLDKNNIDILLPESAAKQYHLKSISPDWSKLESEVSSRNLSGDEALNFVGNTSNIMRYAYDTSGMESQGISLNDIYLGAPKKFKSATTSYVIGHGMDAQGYKSFKDYMNYEGVSAKITEAANTLFDPMQSAGAAMAIYQELRDLEMVNQHTTNDFVLTSLSNGMHPAISLIRYNVVDAFHQRVILQATKPKTFNGENPVLRAELRVDEPVFKPNNGNWDSADYFLQTHLGGRYHSYWSGNRKVTSLTGVGEQKIVDTDNINRLSFSFRYDPKGKGTLARDILIVYDGKSRKWKTVDPENKYEEFTESPRHLERVLKVINEMDNIVYKKKSKKRVWTIKDVFEHLEHKKRLKNPLDINIIMGGQRIPTVLGSSVVIDKVQGFYGKEEGHVIGTNSFELASKHQGDFDIDTLFVYNDWNYGMLKSRYKNSGEILDVNAYSDPQLRDSFDYNPLQINGPWGDPSARVGVSSADGIETKTRAYKKARLAVGRLQSIASAMRSMEDIGFNFEIGGQSLAVDFMGNRGLKQRIGNSFQAAVDGLRSIAEPVLDPAFETWALFGHGLEKNLQTRMDVNKSNYNEDGFSPLLGKNYDKLNPEQRKLSRDIMYTVARMYTNANKIFAGIHAAEGQRSLNASELSRIYNQVRRFSKDPNAYVFNKLLRQYGVLRNSSTMPPEARELIKLFTGEETAKITDWGSAYAALKSLATGKWDKNNKDAFKHYTFKNVLKFNKDILTKNEFSEASPALSIINQLGDPARDNYRIMNGGWSGESPIKTTGAVGLSVTMAEKLIDGMEAFRFAAGDNGFVETSLGRETFKEYMESEDGWGVQLFSRKELSEAVKRSPDDVESRLQKVAMINYVLSDRLRTAKNYVTKLENDRFATDNQVKLARNRVTTIRTAMDYVENRISGLVIKDVPQEGKPDELSKYFGLRTHDLSHDKEIKNISGGSGKKFEHVYRQFTVNNRVKFEYVGRVNDKQKISLFPKSKYIVVKKPFQYNVFDRNMILEGYSLLRGLGAATENGGKGLIPENFRIGFGDNIDTIAQFYESSVFLKRSFNRRDSDIKSLPDFHSGKKVVTKEYADADVMEIASFMKTWVHERRRKMEEDPVLSSQLDRVSEVNNSMIMDVAEFLLLPDAIPNHIYKDNIGVNLPVFKVNNRLAKALFKWLSLNGYNEIAKDIQNRWSDSYNYMSLNVEPGQREGYYKLLEPDKSVAEYERPFFYDLINGAEPLWMPGAKMLLERKFGKRFGKLQNYVLPYNFEYKNIMSTTWNDIVGRADRNRLYNEIFGPCP